MNKNKNILYIFFHFPRTGGNSFMFHFKKNLEADELLLLYKKLPNDKKRPVFENKQEIKNYILSLTAEQKNKIKVIMGHEVYSGIHELFNSRECRYVTIFREPLARTISYYNYIKMLFALNKGGDAQTFTAHNIKTFKNFCEGGHSKNLTFVLLLEKKFITLSKNLEKSENQFENIIKTALDLFYFVGLTEKADEDFLFLCHELGISAPMPKLNQAKKYFKLKNITVEAKKKFLTDNQYDYLLYQTALEKNERFKKNNNFFNAIKKNKVRRTIVRPLYFFGEQIRRLSLHFRLKSKTYRNLINYISD